MSAEWKGRDLCLPLGEEKTDESCWRCALVRDRPNSLVDSEVRFAVQHEEIERAKVMRLQSRADGLQLRSKGVNSSLGHKNDDQFLKFETTFLLISSERHEHSNTMNCWAGKNNGNTKTEIGEVLK